jgi:HlyD family secretion protein
MKKSVIVVIALTLVHWEAARIAGAAEKALAAGASPGNKIRAVGTIEPAEVVDVAAQVAGRIVCFYDDRQAKGKSIDYGSTVQAGDLLARIDNELYAVHVDREQGSVAHAKAELAQARSHRKRAEADARRAQEQMKKKLLSNSDYEVAMFNLEAATASVAAAEAILVQREADLKRAKIELGYTVIRSPIKGTIIDRRANVGQMVGPGASAPSLFLIGTLDRLQVWASVNEADIGRIRAQQRVRFTVDAYPGKTFEGTVEQIRLNAAMTQNVVTYTVVVRITSPTEGLLPYLTAHVEFE